MAVLYGVSIGQETKLASCMKLVQSVTAALLTDVVLVYSDVIQGCATCCATRSILLPVEGSRCLISDFENDCLQKSTSI